MRCCSSGECSLFARISGVILCHGVVDDTVKEVVGNGFCEGGWWWWVNEGYIVVGFVRARVGCGRGFQGMWVVGIGVFIQNCNHGCGSDEADG